MDVGPGDVTTGDHRILHRREVAFADPLAATERRILAFCGGKVLDVDRFVGAEAVHRNGGGESHRCDPRDRGNSASDPLMGLRRLDGVLNFSFSDVEPKGQDLFRIPEARVNIPQGLEAAYHESRSDHQHKASAIWAIAKVFLARWRSRPLLDPRPPSLRADTMLKRLYLKTGKRPKKRPASIEMPEVKMRTVGIQV